MEEVVVTGIGIISSVCNNAEEFKNALFEGKTGIKRISKYNEQGIPVSYSAEINDDNINKILEDLKSNTNNNLIKNMLKILRRSNKGMLSNALAVLEAYNQSNLYDIDGDEVALIIAGNNTTQKLQYDLRNKFNEAPEYLTPTYAMQFMDTDILGTISEIFKITGEGFTVGGASASGNMGIIKGFQLLNAGSEEVCVVVGAMDDLSPMEIQGLYNIGAMGGKKPSTSPESVCRPFDKNHDGFIYGQGAGCIILETLEHAKKRNAPILAEIKAGVINIDGNRLSNPNPEGEKKVMRKSLEMAKINPCDINYINCHGTSSPLGDEVEIEAIENIFGGNTNNLYINSTKPITGHCLTSAGLIEAIATIIQMNNGFLHPNLNLDNPISNKIKFCSEVSEKVNVEYAMNNSFGFGGINTSLVLKNKS